MSFCDGPAVAVSFGPFGISVQLSATSETPSPSVSVTSAAPGCLVVWQKWKDGKPHWSGHIAIGNQEVRKTNQNVSFEKNQKGLILKLGNRKGNNYCRIYKEKTSLKLCQPAPCFCLSAIKL